MEDSVTYSLGPMGRLLRRLHSFEASGHRLPEGLSVNGIRLLKEGLEELYDHLKNLPGADLDLGFTPKWWIKEVRELGYDTEDFFDEFMQSGEGAGAGGVAGDDVGGGRSAPLSTIFGIISKRKQHPPQIAEDFSHLMARVDDARERCQSFQTPIQPDSGQAGIGRRSSPEQTLDLSVSNAPISDVQVDTVGRIFGIEEPMKKLVHLLAFGDDNQKQLKVVPIFGSTGIGKTTIVRTIYHQYGGEFECRAFVRVSRNPDMRRILTCILSQIKAPGAHASCDSQDLIDRIIKHLQGKRYFIVVDDLWTASIWDIISRALPYGDCCSRILTTTQIEDVALACSGYESQYIFKIGPLNDGESRELFFNAVFGSEGEGGCPKEFEVVADGIIRKCGGLPLLTLNLASLLLPSKSNLAIQQWEKVESSLPSTLRTNPTSQGMKDVLILVYNKLPLHLKTCLLYVSMYPEGYTIRKDDLVKQWVAECFFVSDIEHGYFDELVRRGMIQPVDTNYHGEVLSCTVNHMVLDLIRHKSMEDNFIITANCLESTLGLPDKARRLSIQSGRAKGAKKLESITMSQVRSLLFCGVSRCVSFIPDRGLLRVLILHIWAGQDATSFDLTRIGELFRLRYVKVECNITINLPDKIQGLRYLETLQVDGRLSAVPSDIGHLKKLRHLRLPSQSNVRDLGGLVNLHDLHLTWSTVQPADNLDDKMKYLGLILGKLSNLRSVILTSASSSHVKFSSMSILCDSLSSVSPASPHLERLELSPRICIFSSLPKWFKTLGKLCSLKIAVREFSNSDVDIMKGLPVLTALSLYIQTTASERIIFGKAGFSVLKYFKLKFSESLLRFEAGAMPNLQKLKLVFNAQEVHQHGAALICIEHLAGLREISAKIGGSGAADTQSASWISISNDPKNPKIEVVNWKSYAKEDRIMATQEDADGIVEELGENLEEDTEYEYKGEDGNRQPDSGISTLLESSLTSPWRPRYGWRPLSTWTKARPTLKAGPRTTLKSSYEGRDGLLWWHHLVPCSAAATAVRNLPAMAAPPIAHVTAAAGPGQHARRFPGSSMSSVTTRSNSGSTTTTTTAAGGGSESDSGTILEAPNLRIFTFAELKAATRNFKPDTMLGEGGFGQVYKGWVDERSMNPVRSGTGMVITVKKLNQESVQGLQEWQCEVNFLGRIQHPNLVRLLGYCLEDRELLLVYEFMAKGSLENHLFRKSGSVQPISWGLRLRIAIDAARGLAFLHSSEKHVIYRDFKASNILLDTQYNAKLSDFGLAKNGPTGGDSHVTTRVMGTYGYAAPEYVATGHLYVKSDVYGFGVVLLELLTGLRALDTARPAPQLNLVDWAKPYLADRRKLARLVDPRLEGQYPSKAAVRAAQLTLSCLAGDPKNRPSMAEVVVVLEEIERMRPRHRRGASPEGDAASSPRTAARSVHAGGHRQPPRPRSGSDGARSGHPSPRVR